MFGYNGTILRVNLSTGEIRTEQLDHQTAHDYLGGRGLAARILFDELEPGVDPLGPDNKIVLAPGLLAGTPTALGNRTTIAAKSPLTGIWGDAVFGGWFGGEFKHAGFDAMIVEGVSPRPAYLWIHDGEAEIRDASRVWGLETGAAQAAILAEIGEARVLTIGPAGENGVRYAMAVSELRFCAGRTGMGTVMGSKKLKAVAVCGKRPVEIARKAELTAITREINKEIKVNPSMGTLARYGTWNNLSPARRFGILPSLNFQAGDLADGEKLEGDAVNEAILSERKTCPLCPVFCRPVVKMERPYAMSGEYGGPQYETVSGFGSLLGISDTQAIAECHRLLNSLGIDSMSAGICIAWAMECCQRGIDLGQPLHWGDHEAVFQLIRDIAARRGLGALLADGVRAAAGKVGQGSDAWAMHGKGLEISQHDPRGKKAMALSFATSNRGACHLQSCHEDAFETGGAYPQFGLDQPMKRTQFEGKPKLVKLMQDYFGSLGDTLGLCKFPMNAWRPFTPERVVAVVSLVIGVDLTLADMQLKGERIFNLCRLFNLREGIGRADDTIPIRFATPLTSGNTAGERVTPADVSQMLDEYYDLRGWDRDGIPKPDTLRRLGL